MTDHKINVAIAEACGWTEFHTEDFTEMGVPCFVQMALPPGFIHIENSMPLPNYCKDLNAMHEAEKTIFPYYARVYSNKLAKATGAEMSDDTDYFCATARQRAEAFLRSLGKWEATAEDSSVVGEEVQQ